MPVAIDGLAWVVPMLDLGLNGLDDLGTFVADIEHVTSALPPLLSGTDVDDRDSQKGRLSYSNAGVSNETKGIEYQPKKLGWFEILEEVDLVVGIEFPVRANSL